MSFPYRTKELSCLDNGFAGDTTLDSKFDQLAWFHGQSAVPRASVGGMAALPTLAPQHPFVMSTHTVWPTIPQFHP